MEKLTLKQIAELFNVSTNAAARWHDRPDTGFPKPEGTVRTHGRPANVWRRSAVIAWGIKTGRWDAETDSPVSLRKNFTNNVAVKVPQFRT